MSRAKRVHSDLWDMDFYLCLGWTDEQFTKWYKRKFRKSPRIEANDYGMTEMIDGTIVIWTHDKKGIPELAHECLHAANMCLGSRGVEVDLENDEPVAYLLAWLLEKAL